MIPINSRLFRHMEDKRFFDCAYWRKLAKIDVFIDVFGPLNPTPSFRSQESEAQICLHDFIHCFAEGNLVFGSRPA
jgi:hypothetical protein